MKTETSHRVRSKAVGSVASIILGVVLIVLRQSALDWVVVVTGGIMLAYAAIYAIIYFTNSARDNMLLGGAAASALMGLVFVLAPSFVVDLFPIFMGIALMLNGAANLVYSLTELRGSSSMWILAALMSIIVATLGAIMAARPGAIVDMLVMFMGAALVASGIAGLVLAATFRS